MIRKDLTIRYACGSYWIISTDVHLYADASYHAPVMTNQAEFNDYPEMADVIDEYLDLFKKTLFNRRNSRNNFRTVSYFI